MLLDNFRSAISPKNCWKEWKRAISDIYPRPFDLGLTLKNVV